MRKAQFLLAVILALLACHPGGRVPPAHDIEAQIKQVENSLSGPVRFEGISGDNLYERMAFHKVKGLSIAVVKDYEVIWAKGYGWADQSEQQPVTENTLFMAASISKSINSMGVMKLVEDKRLDLNRDINHYLVSWKFPYDPHSKQITTLNLLTHTGGLNNSAPNYTTEDTLPSAAEVLRGTKGSRYVYSDPQPARAEMEPGVLFQYSNTGIGITQVMVSDITQQPYAEYMQETVFKPLGMANSCYSETALKAHPGHVATGYSDGYEVPGKHLVIPFQAAGGLWTTPTDLARFIIEIQLSFAGKSNKVLSRESIQTMLTPYLDATPGFFLKQSKPGAQTYFTHSGVIKGFMSEYYGSLEGGYGVAVMINSGGSAGNIIPEVINSVATVYQWKDFYEPEIRKQPIAVSDELLTQCEGVYTFDQTFAVILKQPDGGHYWTEGRECKMHFVDEQVFFNVEFPTTKELIFDGAGNVTGFQRILNGAQLAPAMKVTDVDATSFSIGHLVGIAWYMLEHHRYEQALRYFKRSLVLNPRDLMSKCNLAHCHLFLGEYAQALQLYREVLDVQIDPKRTFRQVIASDFVFFKQNGFDTTLMDRAFVDLALEMPKGYKP